MFKFSKKKALIGLGGVLISIALFAMFLSLSPSGNITELTFSGVLLRVLSLLFISSTMSFILYIFSDLKSSLLIFGLFALFILLRVVLEFTAESTPSIGLFIIALLVITLLIISARNHYKANNVAINGEQALSDKEKKATSRLG